MKFSSAGVSFGLTCCALAISVQATSESAEQKGYGFVPQSYDYVLLSDNYGGRGYIGLPLVGPKVPYEPIEAFQAKPMSGEQIADLFTRLCLAKPFDRASYLAGRDDVAKDFVSGSRSLPDFVTPKPLLGVTKVPATQLIQENSEFGIASLWLGEGIEGLSNRQYLRYSGGLVITGPVKAKDLYAPQCNLTLRVSELTSSQALLNGIQAATTGFTVVKRVEKPKYGFAVWTKSVAGERTIRISADASYLNKAAQTVHMTIQLLPAGQNK
jgi:hypothetical protein